MSQDELRYWIREFLYNPTLGWSNSKLAFARLLGIDLHGLKSKIRLGPTQARFCGGEQIRFYRRIRRLLAGELAPKQIRARSGQMKWEAVLVHDPRPIRREEVARLRVDLATGHPRLEWVVAPSDAPPLPSDHTALRAFLTPDQQLFSGLPHGAQPRRLPYPVPSRFLRRRRG